MPLSTSTGVCRGVSVALHSSRATVHSRNVASCSCFSLPQPSYSSGRTHAQRIVGHRSCIPRRRDVRAADAVRETSDAATSTSTSSPESSSAGAGRPAATATATFDLLKGSQPEGGSAHAADRPAATRTRPVEEPISGEVVKPFHLVAFAVILGVGLAFLAVLLYCTADIQFQRACLKVLRRLLKTVALRQVMGIVSAMAFVRFGLEPLVKNLRRAFSAQGPWEKSTEYYVLREVYRPLEFLFVIAAFTTLAENFLPQLIALPRAVVSNVVRSTLSLTFVIAAARVVFNIKGRMTREATWQLELKGDLTKQRRVEAVDKLLTVLVLIVASVFGFQAIGLDVNSVLAIGGVGGLAIGLAGREILENLFTGLIILSSNPFEVGDEVMFTPSTGPMVEGIVLDVGWYRTTIRSFEREIYNIPNSVFSRNVVLNVTRKQKEWRFFEFIGLRVEDLAKSSAVVGDMRRILRQDPRIIQKLHRRVFLDKLTREQVSIYISAYVEAANRDAFMAVKQDLLLAFVDCVERNGARLALNRLQLEVMPTQFATAVTGGSRVAAVTGAVEAGAAAEGAAAAGGKDGVMALPSGSSPSAPEGDAPRPAGDAPSSAGSAGLATAPGTAPAGTKARNPSSNTSTGGKTVAEGARGVGGAIAQVASAAASIMCMEDLQSNVSQQQQQRSGQMGSVITASFDDVSFDTA